MNDLALGEEGSEAAAHHPLSIEEEGTCGRRAELTFSALEERQMEPPARHKSWEKRKEKG